MSKIRKLLIAFGITVVIYGLFSYIYNTYIKQPYQSIYILNKDLAKNEVIKEEYLKEVKVLSLSNIEEYISKNEIIEENGNIVASYNIKAGQVLTKDVISQKQDQLKGQEDYEYISLDIKAASKGVSYQIRKGSMVNIYYTSRNKLVEEVLSSKEKIYSSNNEESNVTCKLLENVEIFGIYDSKGTSTIEDSSKDSKSSITFDTVVIRVNKKDAMLISNLKDQGDFNFTIVS